MHKEIIEKAQKEYEELKVFVENYKGTFKELYNELEDAFNFDEEERFFDVNYGSINTTVIGTNSACNDTEHFRLSDIVTIWDTKDGSVFPESEDFTVCCSCGQLVPDIYGEHWTFTDDDEPICNKCAKGGMSYEQIC